MGGFHARNGSILGPPYACMTEKKLLSAPRVLHSDMEDARSLHNKQEMFLHKG